METRKSVFLLLAVALSAMLATGVFVTSEADAAVPADVGWGEMQEETDDMGGADLIRVETLDESVRISEDNPAEVLESILTEKEIDEGYGLVLISSPFTADEVPQSDKDLLISAIELFDASPGAWFGVSLYKMKDIWTGDPLDRLESEGTEKIDSTSDSLSLSVDVPESLKKQGRTFFLVVVHDGGAEIADQGEVDVLCWEANEFSTCLLAYTDPAAPAPGYGVAAWIVLAVVIAIVFARFFLLR